MMLPVMCREEEGEGRVDPTPREERAVARRRVTTRATPWYTTLNQHSDNIQVAYMCPLPNPLLFSRPD